MARDPARHPPQEIVTGDQRNQDAESNPDARTVHLCGGQCVYENLHAILRSDRASHRAENGEEDGGMGDSMPADKPADEGNGSVRLSTEIIPDWRDSLCGDCHPSTRTQGWRLSRA